MKITDRLLITHPVVYADRKAWVIMARAGRYSLIDVDTGDGITVDVDGLAKFFGGFRRFTVEPPLEWDASDEETPDPVEMFG